MLRDELENNGCAIATLESCTSTEQVVGTDRSNTQRLGSTDPDPVIDLIDVSKEFPSEPPVRALNGVTLRIEAGEYVAIVGQSGSGKSTLLNVLGCLDRHTSGTYRFNGVDTSELSDIKRTALRGRRIGFVFQSFHLLTHRTVLENVMLGELYLATSRSARKQHALEMLETVGLSHRVNFLPTRLSGGERQRVAIARALMGNPSVLLCDEPTGNLDTHNTALMLDLLDSLVARGITVLVITHEDTVADRAQRCVRISDGVLSEQIGRIRTNVEDEAASW